MSRLILWMDDNDRDAERYDWGGHTQQVDAFNGRTVHSIRFHPYEGMVIFFTDNTWMEIEQTSQTGQIRINGINETEE